METAADSREVEPAAPELQSKVGWRVNGRLGLGDLNLGVGRGLTGSSDGWAFKAVRSLPFGRGK